MLVRYNKTKAPYREGESIFLRLAARREPCQCCSPANAYVRYGSTSSSCCVRTRGSCRNGRPYVKKAARMPLRRCRRRAKGRLIQVRLGPSGMRTEARTGTPPAARLRCPAGRDSKLRGTHWIRLAQLASCASRTTPNVQYAMRAVSCHPTHLLKDMRTTPVQSPHPAGSCPTLSPLRQRHRSRPFDCGG